MSAEKEESERRQRIRSAAKIREEVRNAVGEALVRDGFSVADLRKETASKVDDMVQRAVARQIKSGVVEKVIRDMIMRSFGSGGKVDQLVKDVFREEARKVAEDWFNNNVAVKFTGGEW